VLLQLVASVEMFMIFGNNSWSVTVESAEHMIFGGNRKKNGCVSNFCVGQTDWKQKEGLQKISEFKSQVDLFWSSSQLIKVSKLMIKA
jgi:hypothetical protein